MRIGIDMMGGDYAPGEIVKGVLLSKKQLSPEVEIVLIGDKKLILQNLQDEGCNDPFEIIHTSQIIEMGENPIKAITQKTDSSIVKGLGLLKSGIIDGFTSAGNTGAIYVASIQLIKNITNISRPVIRAVISKENGQNGILLDVGANADCKPENLCDFAILGSLYAKNIFKINDPKVGLLNIGEEEGKGNMLTQATFKSMKENSKITFVGNVEGRDIFNEKADIIVCDGFTGNIVLKALESAFSLIMKNSTSSNGIEKYNYENYGGTPILGINAPVIIGHGISKAKAIMNMIALTRDVIKSDLTEKIKIAFN